MLKVMIIFGTRPEAIKMAPVVKELQRYPDRFDTVVCVTSQHREMLDQVLVLFEMEPDIDLSLMQENQSLDSLTTNTMKELTKTLEEIRPDFILVQGDTTTAMVAALAGYYKKIPVGHIEAGLRTNDKFNPFPEEINRRMISVISTHNFAPTEMAVKNLLSENISKNTIFKTGNTVVDALNIIMEKEYKGKLNSLLINDKKLILVTAHRRENFGKPLLDICKALEEIVRRNQDVYIIYPVHLNPNVRGPVYELLDKKERILLIPPIEYHELVFLMSHSYIILTDSGGIQEEAPTFGKPVLVMRIETERPEGLKAGVTKLVGTDTKYIVEQVEILLNNDNEYNKMSKVVSPYGDGKAAKRIIDILSKYNKQD